MTSAQMYEFAREAVRAYVHAEEGGLEPDVLWVGGILDDRRAVVWYGEKLFMVTHNTISKETTVDEYVKEER